MLKALSLNPSTLRRLVRRNRDRRARSIDLACRFFEEAKGLSVAPSYRNLTGFAQWLREERGYSDSVIGRILAYLRDIDAFTAKKVGQSELVSSITTWEEIRSVRKVLGQDPEFMRLNVEAKNNVYFWVIDLFGAYVRRNSKLLRGRQLKRHAKENSSELKRLLGKYGSLYDALSKDGISSIEQLKRIHLVRYMDLRGLYSSTAGVQIAEEISQSLRDGSSSARRPRPTHPVPDRNTGHSGEQIIAEQIVRALRDRRQASSLSQILTDIRQRPNMRSRIARLIGQLNEVVQISEDSYIHRACIIDLDRAADEIVRILWAHFRRFNGYSNKQLLYEGTRNNLFMFLNDNGFCDCDTVYNLAKHLFAKECHGGNHFVFYGNLHIWREEPDYPKNVKGLLLHQAQRFGGVITEGGCRFFLDSIRLRVASIKQALQLVIDSTFLQHSGDRFILAESLGVDTAWKESISGALRDLFRGVEYVIPSDIEDHWFKRLPALPTGLPWTRLLLQEVLRCFPDIGYRTIPAIGGQSLDTIHAALVPSDSIYRSFADIVHDILSKRRTLPCRMGNEELRRLLVDEGIIEPNKLLTSTSRALDDHRFVWSHDKRAVSISPG